jgi:ribosomal protein L11 methyltransferase
MTGLQGPAGQGDIAGMDEGFSAYIPQSLHNPLMYNDLLLKYGINPNDVPHNIIEPQNWNAQWEASYEPIVVADKILVRAPFHDLQMDYAHTITIQPKNTS